MGEDRRRWRYRDPSWAQIGLLYVLALVFALPGTSLPRILFAVAWAAVATILLLVKVSRDRRRAGMLKIRRRPGPDEG
ncbi:hypothetical protein [Arthrobacter koreensis]|uniref:hypothetical protein n=1 Tax=Arthrobacter koreensis TaxID=199136 RepID=UPI002DB666BB|nr:hypothetical protein [Arthrobacter koreensis]MEB7505290.1 hypothetical protein [Arthrobacter koreensis]